MQSRICGSRSRIYNEGRHVKFVNRNQSCAILFPTKDKVLEFCDTVLQLEHKPVWEKWIDQYYEPYFKRLNDHLKGKSSSYRMRCK